MAKLLENLKKSGILISRDIKRAMEEVNPAEFTDHDLEYFWNDEPVPFLTTDLGTSKTISAPHMVVTMLHHLEIMKGQTILLMGSKGGYISALLSNLVGENGKITIIEPHEEVRKYTREKIKKFLESGKISLNTPDDIEVIGDNHFDRVLMTGFVKKVPSEIKFKVKEAGFILGPVGSIIHQRLIKKERQGDDWIDTDLGGVVFGPMDISDLEKNLFEPNNLVEHMESALELILEVIEIEEESLNRINNLIWSLKELPPGIPIVDEYSTEEEILENPVMELLLSEMEWLGPLWPILTGIDGIDIGNIESINSEYYSNTGGHEDLIP
jgi:protein-L-isoaspartate(D-aspartate) O-methyltransferase